MSKYKSKSTRQTVSQFSLGQRSEFQEQYKVCHNYNQVGNTHILNSEQKFVNPEAGNKPNGNFIIILRIISVKMSTTETYEIFIYVYTCVMHVPTYTFNIFIYVTYVSKIQCSLYKNLLCGLYDDNIKLIANLLLLIYKPLIHSLSYLNVFFILLCKCLSLLRKIFSIQN